MRAFVRAWMVGAAVVALALGFGATAAHAAPFVYVTNQGSSDVSQYDAATDGRLTPLSPAVVPGADALEEFLEEGLAVSRDGKSVYVAVNVFGPAGGRILQYDVGPRGALSPKTPASVAAGTLPRLMAVSADGRSLYAADWDIQGRVLQYTIGANGALSPKSPPAVNAGRFTIGVAVSPDGRSLYATNFDASAIPTALSSISQYDIGADGTLSPKTPPTVPTRQGPIGIAVSPDGASVYAAHFFNPVEGAAGTISQFGVGGDGALTPKTPPTVVAGRSPRILGLSPDGRSLYASDVSIGVLQFDIGTDGALSRKTPSVVPAGIEPTGLAVSADGSSVYVTNHRSNTLSQYDVGAGGALLPKTSATVPTGDFPVAVATTPALLRPVTKDDCKDNGWRRFGFRNQGQCIASLKRGPKP